MAKKLKILLFLSVSTVTMALVFCASAAEPKASTVGAKEIISGAYQITKVIDGDTIQVKVGNGLELVRLLGINTPEVDNPYRKQECFGPEASAFAKKLLDKKTVFLIPDKQSSDRDKYNRLLRYVFLPDGLFVDAELIKNGFAYNYIYEPFAFMKQFDFWEKEAKKNKVGLWGKCGS